MSKLMRAIQKHKDLPIEEQKKAGQPVKGDIGEEHKNFLKTVIGMLDRKEIDVLKPESFLKKDVYDSLDFAWKAKVDKALPNITDQLRQIEEYYRDSKTPNESTQLQTMVEHLWLMKQRIEDHYDVFKF